MNTQVIHDTTPFAAPSSVWRLPRPLVSVGVAALVAASLYFSGREWPLPALPWAGAFLLLAVEQDVRRLRIPNWLTLSGLIGALALAGFDLGWSGVQQGLLGAAGAFALLFVPFALRWMGAGDVKAFMVLGAFWGPLLLLPLLWWMLAIGGLIAIGLVAAREGLPQLARRWGRSIYLTLAARRPVWIPAEAGSAAAGGLPFAVAMGFGVAAYQIWGTPWA